MPFASNRDLVVKSKLLLLRLSVENRNSTHSHSLLNQNLNCIQIQASYPVQFYLGLSVSPHCGMIHQQLSMCYRFLTFSQIKAYCVLCGNISICSAWRQSSQFFFSFTFKLLHFTHTNTGFSSQTTFSLLNRCHAEIRFANVISSNCLTSDIDNALLSLVDKICLSCMVARSQEQFGFYDNYFGQ